MKDYKAGSFVSQGSYKSFTPSLINKEWSISSMPVISRLGKADRQLGRLDMHSDYVPNINWFIQMHVKKEATQSSKIEGTQTNMEDALLDEADIAFEKRDDWREVQNYIRAMNESIQILETLPISTRLICQAHKILLQGARGEHKLPGAFRKSQNWIGGSSLASASFIPPHFSQIGVLMGDLEKLVHNEEFAFPQLLKIALIHYQFETIHPFLDGNGRIGRLLITLYLVEKGLIKKPILYLSDYFERHRSTYYEKLMRVRQANAIEEWFMFFLEGVIEMAESGIRTFDGILRLQRNVQERIQTLGQKSHNAQAVIEQLYQNPFIKPTDIASHLGVTPPTAYALAKDLEELGVLKEFTGAKRGKIYMFKEYFDLFRD